MINRKSFWSLRDLSNFHCLANCWLILILLAAFVFRFWLITTLPGGLFPDEAANGLDVNSILAGQAAPFYERGNGREALFFYALAVSVAIFGRGPWQHHIVSAGFGFFAVLAGYFLTKRLFGKNIALLASFLYAVSSYAVTLSRTSFRANAIPLLTTLTLLFLVKAFQEKKKSAKIRSALLAGICFGLGFYTYISFRMMIPLLLILGLILVYANRNRLKKAIKPYLNPFWAFASSFAAAFAWLAYYFIRHPQSIFGRAGQVSIFNADLNQGDVLGTFLRVLKVTILGFFTAGDLNWRHNVSGFAFLSPTVSPFFAMGLIIFTIAIWRLFSEAREKKIRSQTLSMGLAAMWFWFMIVPEISTAEGIPHGLRLVGVMPAIFIFAGWCLYKVWEYIKQSNILPVWKKLYAVIFLSSIFVYNFTLYFGIAANSPEYYYAFRSDLTRVSQYLNQRNLPAKTYLSLDKFSVQTVDYLTTETGNPYVLIDPAETYKIRLKPGDQVIFTMSTLFDRLKFMAHNHDANLVYQERNNFGEITMLVYQKP